MQARSGAPRSAWLMRWFVLDDEECAKDTGRRNTADEEKSYIEVLLTTEVIPRVIFGFLVAFFSGFTLSTSVP
jgi:hypothetical protein